MGIDPSITTDAALVSRLLAAYLDPQKQTESAREAADAGGWAAEELLQPELEAIVRVMHGDDVYPGMTFDHGVEFGILAAVAILELPLPEARKTVSELHDALRTEFQQRIVCARQSKALKATG
jgi:hypothetical protein